MLRIHCKLFLAILLSLSSACIQDTNEDRLCDQEFFIDPRADVEATISSPRYPELYGTEEHQIWCISAPENVTVSLICDIFDIPKSDDCEMDALIVSSNKDAPRPFCGSKPFHTKSNSNEMVIKFYSSKKSKGGKFFCSIEVQVPETNSLRAIVYDNCDCGYSYSLRVVGGEETGINEFPFMAGLVDSRRGPIVVCGATIISKRHVLTAEHCLTGLEVASTGVLVGEHNIDTTTETPATKLIKARSFIRYPYYNAKSRQYDIAMIVLQSDITYSIRVGPACLPFVSRNWDLTGQQVTILGWGTIEFGGPRSKYLRKAYVDVINIQNCINSYGSDIEPYTQLCAYRRNSDACQYDSGGPLVWRNPNIERYEIVGIVSYGRSCASADPSVNTRVAPFLQWIIDYAEGATFCYMKSY